MAKHTGKHSAKRSKAAGVAAFLVLLFSGFLLSTNLRVNRSVVVSNDTAELVEQRVKKVNSLRSEIDALSTRVNDLSKTLDSQNADGSQDSESAGNGTMLPAVEGPGLVVTLDDSPLWENMVDANGSSANINDYVVHQQDIEAVVNALWAGGAESMQIMDQRVLFNSAVRCSGNVLLLQGKKYSPPFKISAIGPVEGMRKALDDSEEVSIYKQYVSAFGLGWQVDRENETAFRRDRRVAAAVAVCESARKRQERRLARGEITIDETCGKPWRTHQKRAVDDTRHPRRTHADRRRHLRAVHRMADVVDGRAVGA